ncbi:MAG: hypothetical protein PHN61_11725 [Methanothrix sp.]|nr:hypothetical protein [Methanothrix sp.]
MAEYIFFIDEGNVPFTYFTPTLSVGPLPCPYNITDSNIFLNFAIEDRKSEDLKGLVNSFGNMKKALHLRIDTLLQQYGLLYHYRKSNFPAKLDLLDNIGILPTTIARNLNVERNLLEHEYIIPEPKRVDEAIDVVQLIYMASQAFLDRSIIEGVVGLKEPPLHAIMRLEPNRGEIHFFEFEAGPFLSLQDSGIQYFSGSIRAFPELRAKLKISENPFKIIILNDANKKQWLQIVKIIIKLIKEDAFDNIAGNNDRKIDDGGGWIRVNIALPVSALQADHLTEAVATLMQERMERKIDESDGKQKDTSTQMAD